MKRIATAVLVLSFACFAFAAEDVVEATHGTISKIDQAGKTVVIKTADGQMFASEEGSPESATWVAPSPR